MKRRFLCLLLVLTMLPIQSFAVNSGVGQTHNSTATSDGETASGHSTGVVLGIQTMDDRAEYQVKSKNGNEAEFIEGAAVNNKGLAAAARHFLYSYPEPDTKNALTASTVYIVPMRAAEPKYMTGTDGGKLYLTDITGHYYASEQRAGYSSKNPIYNTMDMSISNYLYAAATSGKFDKEAGADAYDYFNGYIEKMYLPIARDLIGYIFANYKDYRSGDSNWNQVDVDKVNLCWKRVYEYNIENRTNNEKTIQKICNYAAVLLSLARLLPEENWDLYEQNISQFVVNAIRGEAYYPVLITAEMCCAYRYENGGNFDAWMTVPEYFTICSGTSDESQFHHADTSPLNVTALGSGDKNMAQTILKAARKNVGANAGYNYDCGSVVGLDKYGKDIVNSNKVGDWCRAMTSLSDAAINSISNDWGLSVPNTAEALWGCGIFGGTEALTIKKEDVVELDANANVTVNGSTDITIDTSGLDTQKAQGSGQLTIPITFTIDIRPNATYSMKESLNGEIVQVEDKNAIDLPSYLEWYRQLRDAGKIVPDHSVANGYPRIRIWIKGAQREGSNLSDGSDLLNNANYVGYKGDGTEFAGMETDLGLTFAIKDVKSQLKATFESDDTKIKVDEVDGALEIDFTDITEVGVNRVKERPLVIETDVNVNYNLSGDDAEFQFWVKAATSITVLSPVYNDDGEYQLTLGVPVAIPAEKKYDKYTLTAIPSPEKKTPTYKSTIAPAYSELKQGTPGNETFNSMTGTPTNTNGTYYQYFASGGSEFVVEFEAEYVENQTAIRTEIQKQREPVLTDPRCFAFIQRKSNAAGRSGEDHDRKFGVVHRG